jgi:hypothetical protein
MMLVTLTLTAKRAETTDGGSIDVFIPASDSLSEIRRLAVAALRRFAEEILSAPPAESSEEMDAPLDATAIQRATQVLEKTWPKE